MRVPLEYIHFLCKSTENSNNKAILCGGQALYKGPKFPPHNRGIMDIKRWRI
jgi:hypothetical protein